MITLSNLPGEAIAIHTGGTHYVLSPTIGILCNIERRTGLDSVALIVLLQAATLPASALRLILREAAGPISDDAALTDEDMPTIAPQIRAFLLQGIGCLPNSIGTDTLKSLRQPDWRDMFLTYVGIMGRPIREFWNITFAEYALAVEGFCLLHRIDIHSVAPPATSQDLAEMLKRFPDEKAGEAETL